MKYKILILLAAFLTNIWVTYGQGTVVFNNNASPTFNLWTNDATLTASNLMSGTNSYRIGLYAEPGTNIAAGSLTLVGLATNAFQLPGKFNGGSSFLLPNGYAVQSLLTFQIRAWSFAAGLSYDEALSAASLDPLNIALGSSAFGTALTGGPPIFPAGALFGTNPGNIWAFGIYTVPEPSSIALGLVGLAAMALFRRKSK